MKKLFKQDKGFTLIEILIAISLLAIIAAIVVPNLTGLIGRGQSQSYKADQKLIQAAVDIYFTDPGNRWENALGQMIRQYPTWGRNNNNNGASNDPGNNASAANTSYINFSLLVDQNLLTDYPASADPVQNGSTAFTGNYGWYVDSKGRIQSSPAWSAAIGYP